MKVVLLENVKNVGNKGDIVEVKDGYGRNFLIKNKKAVIGSDENIEAANQAKARLRLSREPQMTANYLVP
jgi:large subunit ribosomal protein L9